MSFQIQNSFNDGDPDNLYYDLSIYNASSSPQSLEFIENRAEKILQNPETYEVSVIRLSCDTAMIPLMIARPQLSPNTDPNKLIWSVSMSYMTYTVQQYLTYIPQDITQTVPVIGNTNIEIPYYFIYQYSHFVRMVNNALSDCWNALKIAAGKDWDSTWTNPNAFIDLDPTSGLASATFDELQYDNSLKNPISVFFNSEMHTLFGGFPFILKNFNAPLGCNVMFDIYNNNGTNVFQFQNWNGLMCFAEYSTLATWECVQSIALLSNTIPVVPSLASVPKLITDATLNDYTPSRNNQFQLFDIQFAGEPLGNAVKDSGSIAYTATPPYRMMSLNPTSNFKSINLVFVWISKLNNIHQIYLDSNCGATCKLYFKRKK